MGILQCTQTIGGIFLYLVWFVSSSFELDQHHPSIYYHLSPSSPTIHFSSKDDWVQLLSFKLWLLEFGLFFNWLCYKSFSFLNSSIGGGRIWTQDVSSGDTRRCQTSWTTRLLVVVVCIMMEANEQKTCSKLLILETIKRKWSTLSRCAFAPRTCYIT